MLNEKQVEALRNVILCDVHEDTWLEIMGTLTALFAVLRAAEIALPMAKGYAHEHPVGSNQKYADELLEALVPFREGEGNEK